MSRATTQKAAIRAALEEAPGPLLPEELLEAAQQSCPTLGQATVYRALRRMEDAGEVARVVVGDGRPRYEAAQPHHHHFRCRECERVYDIEGCVRSPRQLGENLPRGFVLEGHELTLLGVCADCAR
jgi:Fur family ferric uptake transcriptional regulator